MKGKKNKRFRQNLEFYEMHFRFRAPYKLLIDGTFLAKCEKINLNLSKKMHNIFKKKFILSTTKCIKNELSLLGSDFDHVKYKAEELLFNQRCFHQMNLEPSNCIQKHIGSENKPQYIVATCDYQLIKYLESVPKVPILTFVSDNVLDFKEASAATKKLLEKKDAQKYEPSGKEKEAIAKVRKADKQDAMERRMLKQKNLVDKLGVAIKKKAKAPNPLSMRKKGKKAKKKASLNSKLKKGNKFRNRE
jgi:U3 small nucleolar RNA-associated protein 23